MSIQSCVHYTISTISNEETFLQDFPENAEHMFHRYWIQRIYTSPITQQCVTRLYIWYIKNIYHISELLLPQHSLVEDLNRSLIPRKRLQNYEVYSLVSIVVTK